MKFLFTPVLNSVKDIVWGLEELGHNVIVLENTIFDPNSSDANSNKVLSETLSLLDIDYVISPCFIPSVANVCYESDTPYISWTYDSPLVSLFTESIYHPTNYIFVFDRDEYLRLEKLQLPHLYHMPLAANVSRIGALEISAEDERTYSHSISFVGSLYEQNKYNELIQGLPEEIQVELKSYLTQNLCNWSKKRSWPSLSDETIAFMKNVLGADPHAVAPLLDESTYLGILFLSRKLAEMERITVLNATSSVLPVDLYTGSSSEFLQNVNTHGSVDYYTTTNKIFFLSKINLNITLPSIETGIPQRIFDIMSCGGFVLTNYQEELSEIFEIGKEIEVYHNIEELIQKCIYYLTHEEERLNIAINGYQKVCNSFSYPHQLQKIIDIVKENPS